MWSIARDMRQGPSRPSLAHLAQHLSRAAPPLPAPRLPERDIRAYAEAQHITLDLSKVSFSPDFSLRLSPTALRCCPTTREPLPLALARHRPTEPFVLISPFQYHSTLPTVHTCAREIYRCRRDELLAFNFVFAYQTVQLFHKPLLRRHTRL